MGVQIGSEAVCCFFLGATSHHQGCPKRYSNASRFSEALLATAHQQALLLRLPLISGASVAPFDVEWHSVGDAGSGYCRRILVGFPPRFQQSLADCVIHGLTVNLRAKIAPVAIVREIIPLYPVL